jgi:hypothetical protein
MLRTLTVWRDHDEKGSWSIVNERVILRPLEPLIDQPDLNMIMYLPKVHPGWEAERPDWYYGNDSSPSRFRICRRLRQRFHTKKEAQGRIGSVLHQEDFPVMLGWEGYEEMSLEEVERRMLRERRMGLFDR